MAITDYFNANRAGFQKPLLAPKKGAMRQTGLGIQSPTLVPTSTTSFGETLPDLLQGRKDDTLAKYREAKADRASNLASDVVGKSSGPANIKTDEYGVVQNKQTDFNDFFNNQLKTTTESGKLKLQTEEAKAQWQSLQDMQDMSAGFTTNIAPGAKTDGSNPGAKAVAIAMEAYKNGTPYVWGGNSLTGGVDCSGLVQQVYKRLGINVPRTTYEQAKQGRVVSSGQYVPGDLVFYNTGSRDPNGIGQFGHVAIYIGNGKVIEAPGRGKRIQINSINTSGQPARVIRPW